MAEYCIAHLMIEMTSGSTKMPYAVMRAKLLGSSHDKPTENQGCPRCQSSKT